MVQIHPDPPIEHCVRAPIAFRWFHIERTRLWGHSSAGRAPALHAGGRRFDPAWLHHFPLTLSNRIERLWARCQLDIQRSYRPRTPIPLLFRPSSRFLVWLFFSFYFGCFFKHERTSSNRAGTSSSRDLFLNSSKRTAVQ